MARGLHILWDGRVPRGAWEGMEAHLGVGFMLERAVLAGGATPLDGRVIYLPAAASRPGSSEGGTAWVGLDESHVTLHWYLERDEMLLALDVFTCGTHADPRAVLDAVLGNLPGCAGRDVVLDRFAGGRRSHHVY